MYARILLLINDHQVSYNYVIIMMVVVFVKLTVLFLTQLHVATERMNARCGQGMDLHKRKKTRTLQWSTHGMQPNYTDTHFPVVLIRMEATTISPLFKIH